MKPSQSGNPGPLWAVMPLKKNREILVFNVIAKS
jgi:hypothetical protein